jgi:hypothetical protein
MKHKPTTITATKLPFSVDKFNIAMLDKEITKGRTLSRFADEMTKRINKGINKRTTIPAHITVQHIKAILDGKVVPTEKEVELFAEILDVRLETLYGETTIS